MAVRELVAGEPQAVPGLQVVARRRLAVSGPPAGEEMTADVGDPRGRRDDGGDQEDERRERYKAWAAWINTSKSGTSESS